MTVEDFIEELRRLPQTAIIRTRYGAGPTEARYDRGIVWIEADLYDPYDFEDCDD